MAWEMGLHMDLVPADGDLLVVGDPDGFLGHLAHLAERGHDLEAPGAVEVGHEPAFPGQPGAEDQPEAPVVHAAGEFGDLDDPRLERPHVLIPALAVGVAFAFLDRCGVGKSADVRPFVFLGGQGGNVLPVTGRAGFGMPAPRLHAIPIGVIERAAGAIGCL